MFRDPRGSGEEERSERFTRDRMQPGEPAYQRPTTQTPLSTARPLPSPTTPSAHPQPFTHHSPHQHRPPTSPRQPDQLPPLSTALYTAPKSSYYDPTSDHGLGQPHGPPPARYESHLPSQQPRDSHAYQDARPPESPYNTAYRSPVAASFAHHSPLQRPVSHGHGAANMEAMSRSPVSPTVYPSMNRAPVQPPPNVQYERRPSVKEEVPPPAPKRDPMSLSSIMDSGADPDPPSKTHPRPAMADPHAFPKPAPNPLFVKQETLASPAPADLAYPDRHPVSYGDMAPVGGALAPSRPVPLELPAPDEAEVEAALARIETNEMKDLDATNIDYDREFEEYTSRSQKRALEVIAAEDGKRKRRRTAQTTRLFDVFSAHRDAAKQNYAVEHEAEAWQQVQNQEIAEEKERKKDMQRKRRREKTIQNEEAKRNEALARANEAENEEEREKHLREASKAERKAKTTSQLLQGNAPSKDFREVTPHAPNFEGGTMSSFQASDEMMSGKRKGGRSGGRLKKSKEQKQAEKDAAAAGQAALDRGEDLPLIAPREEARLEALKSRSATEDYSGPITLTSYNSQAYHNLYCQIWKDIGKKDVPKVYRIKVQSLDTKQSNLRKTAQLASKEARRWQMRTNKSMKDVQARAKRSMREMLSFWKRNERDERDQRKLAERAELENARKAEAEKESNRQKRKLNFLIQQTELYSHFIGKKAKTEEIERSTDDADAAPDAAAHASGPVIDVSIHGATGAKVTNFKDLDFDNEDESALQAAAIANAQHAVKEAQDRARAFNNDGDQNMDDGELNFQNPSGLQDEKDFIPQPKLLNCTLKEYQVKGLNWLVNLYEQGINGILADEMGLGKTVQSISIMAYLAEKHGYWGPFLVIAPASTLHNWQQEIAKFVPDFKVIPYWGTAGDRKILRKYWDRRKGAYSRDAQMHVLVTSYQLVVQDAAYFQKMQWQYMILDEAQAIKSSQSSRWKSLLGFKTRNRLLLTGTPIQNNMQELWALLHFIMPSLFDSHDEFSDWFSKDIESHAQSNTKLNEDQLKRLHMILKPFMLRRVKKHVQKELGDKIELDVFCDLTYRQRAYYTSLRNKISLMDLIEKAVGDEQDTATLMNLVMQFRKVCNHPDLFERTDTWSPFAFAHYAETASFMREGQNVNVSYSTRNLIEYRLPRLVGRNGGRLDIPGPDNPKAGFKGRYLYNLMNIWKQDNVHQSSKENGAFAWLRLANLSANEASNIAKQDLFQRAVALADQSRQLPHFDIVYEGEGGTYTPLHSMLNIVERQDRASIAEVTSSGFMHTLLNVSQASFEQTGLNVIERCAEPAASAPPIELYCSSQGVMAEKQNTFFNVPMRNVLYGISQNAEREQTLLESKMDTTAAVAIRGKLPPPIHAQGRYTHINVPSMARFVTDSGKLAKLDSLLKTLKAEGHRVLLYFQMTRMMDMVEEYLTYRKYKYCRLDGSTKLEDRRDTVAKFQAPDSDIFVFLLSTRAGGLGINLVAADTVIFYDSDWNPTIDSQAMDRAHRLGQTRQVTVYRLITRGTIEERIRKRALQKEEVQRVVITGGAGAQVDFNTRSRENRTKDIAMWLADDEQAAEIEKKEAELAEAEKNAPQGKKRKRTKKAEAASLDDMYHEGEGHFDTSEKPSGASTPLPNADAPAGKRRKGMTKKAKTAKQRLAVADGQV